MPIAVEMIVCEYCGREKAKRIYAIKAAKHHFCSCACSNKWKGKYGFVRNCEDTERECEYSARKPDDCPVKVEYCTECYLDDCSY